eukprot:709485-Amphidinium_carterae.1
MFQHVLTVAEACFPAQIALPNSHSRKGTSRDGSPEPEGCVTMQVAPLARERGSLFVSVCGVGLP